MKIRHLAVRGLHGYLNFSIGFYPDLTFLIGINGSGKTSAVRALMALLTPAVRDLSRLEFESLETRIEHGEKDLTITARRSEHEILLTVSGVTEPLSVRVIKPAGFESRVAFEERELAYYREQEGISATHPVMQALSSLPTPMFLDLERRAQVGVERRRAATRHMSQAHFSTPTLIGGTLLESLRDAQSLAERAYRLSQAKQLELADRLKQDLILTHFSSPEANSAFLSFRAPTDNSIANLKNRQAPITSSLRAIGVDDSAIAQTVAGFFSNAISLAGELRGKDATDFLSEKSEFLEPLKRWIALQPQLERIETVSQHIERYNRAATQIALPIERYLELANGFLSDSNKSLEFSATGDLQISIKGQKNRRPITALSSGERQIVVILTHLAFNDAARRANVLIIDEPELSLHLKWQQRFVTALEGASAKLQMILATHSPAIVMERDDKCIDVMEHAGTSV